MLLHKKPKKMWKEIKNTCLYLSFQEADGYVIYVTDYLRIWYAYFSRPTLIHCLKESNVLLQMRDDVMVQKALEILSNPSELKNANTVMENSVLTLTLTKQFGYNFKVILKLVEGSKELFFQKITQQILKTIQELQSSQSELCELLVKKDKEIKKLRDTGQTHSHEKTNLFKADIFISTHSKIKNYFGSEQIPSSVLEKTVIPLEDMKIIKQENGSTQSNGEVELKVKVEPDSQTSNKMENGTAMNLNEVKTMKEEADQTIKREMPATSSPRKRIKKLNL